MTETTDKTGTEATPTTDFAKRLTGLILSGWSVDELVDRTKRKPDATGGMFSQSYRLSRDGAAAFLKAFDLASVLRTNTGRPRIEVLAEMATDYQFEQRLLGLCDGTDRVVRVIGGGELEVEAGNPFSWVPYIIFELADCDVRQHMSLRKGLSVAWLLRAFHNITVGLAQLHRRGIAHQDFKPSNVLFFEREGLKLGDLGRGSLRGVGSRYDQVNFAGDGRYAPPELLYGHLEPEWDRRRLAADLFMLGSFGVYLFTQVSMAPMMMQKNLAPEHGPGVWGGLWSGSFEEALPYLQASFAICVDELKAVLPAPRSERWDYRDRYVETIARLCEPDPGKRGLRDRAGNRTLSLERVISVLNELAVEAELSDRVK